MLDQTRYLITTADERTWKFDQPVLFLGEWCRLYERKSVWSKMDAVVASPFILKPERKVSDIDYVQGLSNELLIEISAVLNVFHGTNYSIRYWNILLGHWLKRHVAVCFNRYFTLQQALSKYKVSATTIFEAGEYGLATSDSFSFILACNDDIWNNILYSRVLKYMNEVEVEIEIDSLTECSNTTFLQATKPFIKQRSGIKQIIKTIGSSFLPKLCRNSDAFVVNSYMPRWQDIKLQLALGQCPQIWQSPPLQSVPISLEIRRRFSLGQTGHVGFDHFVRSLISEMIPACYLEGYSTLCKQAESLPWPKTPKFIFTSNSFDADELFKAWVGNKVEQGVPYLTGQHGNNYGTHCYFGNPTWP